MSKVKTTVKMKATAKKKTTTAKATTTKKATAKPKVKATTKPAAKKKTTTAKPKVKATTKKATTTKKAVTKKATTKKATAKPKVKATTNKATTKPAAKKKTTTAKPKAKATAKKPAVKRATSKFKRGYDVKLVNKELTFGGIRDLYEVYEVAGPKVDKTRIFVDEESVLLFIEQNEIENGLNKSFESAVKRTTTKSERKEMQAAKELSELVPELETIVDANFRDTNAKRPEDTDK